MDFFEVIKNRHCCRAFDPKKEIKEELIAKIVDAGRKAPSAGGIYPVEFTIIKDRDTKEKICQAAFGQSFLIEAPIVLVIWADIEKTAAKYGERGRNFYVIQDAAAAAENIFLAATALGLGCCWVGSFNDKEIGQILKLQNGQKPIVIMPIGYKK